MSTNERFMKARALVVLGLMMAATAVGAQSRLATVDQLRLVEDQIETLEEQLDVRTPDIVIGMDAYREVLESGRYRIGPGDVFVLLVPGLEEAVDAPVLAEGSLMIPKIGRIRVAGLTLAEAREAIEHQCRTQLPGVDVTIELGSLRTFPVSVAGLVKSPGRRIANGVERVSEVIRKAGGLADGASQRDIRLIRGGALRHGERAAIDEYLQSGDDSLLPEGLEVLRVDLAMYRATGRREHNPFIQDGDIIQVPASHGFLYAREAWRRAGRYEFAPGDRISDLVALSLGPAEEHDRNNIYLFRFEDGRRQTPRPVDLQAALAGDPEADLHLQPGDWLVARTRHDYQLRSTVLVVGEVEVPGSYVIAEEGTRLRDVLQMAGGFTEEASLARARVVREFDSEAERDPEIDRILRIPPEAWNREERQYFNMKSRERRGQMVVDFVNLMLDDAAEEQNILLRPGDAIIIPSSLETVLVSGQAANPGAIPYDESFGVQDYIDRAGGFGWQASDEVVVIQARTGERRKAEDVTHLEPGDRIWIKERPERNYWGIFNESMSVAGQVATVMLLFVTVLR